MLKSTKYYWSVADNWFKVTVICIGLAAAMLVLAIIAMPFSLLLTGIFCYAGLIVGAVGFVTNVYWDVPHDKMEEK